MAVVDECQTSRQHGNYLAAVDMGGDGSDLSKDATNELLVCLPVLVPVIQLLRAIGTCRSDRVGRRWLIELQDSETRAQTSQGQHLGDERLDDPSKRVDSTERSELDEPGDDPSGLERLGTDVIDLSEIATDAVLIGTTP
ncbi:MAG: hypothetical protein ACYCWW_08805 [Deltaproteobacteria bacterium]